MNLFGILLLGQALSILITLTGVFSQLLSTNDIHIPTTQSALNYILLACIFLPTHLLYKRNTHAELPILLDSAPVQSYKHAYTSYTIYALLALIDVEGNYLLVKAYQYTTITSVQLLDCFTIPCVILLSRFVLHTVYNYKQLAGAVISLVGLCLLVVNDVYTRNTVSVDVPLSNVLIGDSLVLIGCALYAGSNVAQELIVKANDTIEWLAMIGLFGSVWSVLQILVFERQELTMLYQSLDNVYNLYYMLGFNISLYLLYLTVPLVLKHSGALFLNLSFLSADFWAILFARYLFHETLNFVYFVAFSVIIAGLLLYNIASVDNTLTLTQTVVYLLPDWVCRQLNVVKPVRGADAVAVSNGHISDSPRVSKSYQLVDCHNKYDIT